MANKCVIKNIPTDKLTTELASTRRDTYSHMFAFVRPVWPSRPVAVTAAPSRPQGELTVFCYSFCARHGTRGVKVKLHYAYKVRNIGRVRPRLRCCAVAFLRTPDFAKTQWFVYVGMAPD